jgi:uncharacterized protein (TIRG00374 family)
MTDTSITPQVVTDTTGEGTHQSATFRYERSPVDILHMVVYLVIALVVLALTVWAESAILGFEEDLITLFDFLNPTFARVVAGVLVFVAFAATIGTWIVPLATKRYRLFLYILTSNIVAGLSVWGIERWLNRDSPKIINAVADRAGLDTLGIANVYPVAQMCAAFMVLGPFVSRKWRRAGMVTVAIVVVLRLIVSYQLPANLFFAVPFGAAIGAGILFAFGRPDRRPTLEAIHSALVDSGLPVTSVRAAKVDARGSTPYFATLDDGNGLFVKVLGSDNRAADLLFRIYRYLRLKNVGDERPFSSLRRTVEHEALVSLMARDLDVRTPRMRGVVQVGNDSMLLAYDMIAGTSLDGMPDEAITDDIMRKVWEQIAILRRHRIAHRDLRRANVFVADDGTPWIIDFGFSELAVSDTLLKADVAQMLASFVVVASPERVARTAIDVLGRDAVAESLPRLQLTALSGATQTALKHHKGALKELQQEVMRQCEVSDVKYEPLTRVNKKTILILVVLAGATYFLIPQFADLPGIVDQVKEANWSWLPLVLLASVVTYIGATFSLAGAVPDPLQTRPLFLTQVGSSFCSKIAPAGLGGMALNVRFLQKQGVDEPVAVSAVGLNTIAGFVGHMTLILVFMVWAGRRAMSAFHLPDPKWFIIAIAAIAVLVVIGWLIPTVRALILTKLVPILKRAVHGITEVLRRPGKVVSLIGGSVVVTTSYLVALYFAMQAFGGGLPFATVGAVYLVGAAVASAAPTPGGLGAMEAALIAGLVGAGLDKTIAVPAVFLYRLCTFWAPILPGWGCFTWLQRREYI